MTNSKLAPAKGIKEKQENPLLSIAFNILLPVIVLEKLTTRLGEHGATWALLIALAFPIGYGALDYAKRRKKNFISMLGVINVLFTGGLALMQLEGFWFAIKEAGFPLIMGIAVTISAFTRKPFMETMAANPAVFNIELINEKITANNKWDDYKTIMRRSTHYLAASFYLSSLLNFVLARMIFIDIDPQLAEAQRMAILNGQVSKMTWMGFVVIAAPLMIFTGAIMWKLIVDLKRITDLSLQEMLPHPQ